jgi:hypothetical protein
MAKQFLALVCVYRGEWAVVDLDDTIERALLGENIDISSRLKALQNNRLGKLYAEVVRACEQCVLLSTELQYDMCARVMRIIGQRRVQRRHVFYSFGNYKVDVVGMGYETRALKVCVVLDEETFGVILFEQDLACVLGVSLV